MSDPNSWLRKLDTAYDNGNLVWSHTFANTNSSSTVYFSYFPPFTHDQHVILVDKCRTSPLARVSTLGHSLDGRDMHCISVGNGSRVCWIIHRQHPGETMAEYYAEGLLSRLLGLDADNAGKDDAAVTRALAMYTFYIIPCMCPDGSVRGHLRTNGVGANLNREWCNSGGSSSSNSPLYTAPSALRSPEVQCVWNKMEETGVDCFLDVHGDEELPFNFLSGAELTENWGIRLQSLHGAFLGAYVRANDDMQKTVGYPPPADSSKALPNVATNAVANRFDCLAATLEMPFKDCRTNPDPNRGWNPDRSRKLGASVIEALEYIHPFLRNDNEFWNTLPEDDAYMPPSSHYIQ